MFCEYAESTALESIALMAAMTMPALLLQKPHAKSTAKDHVKCLERRLDEWKQGNISGLLLEGRSLQQRISRKKRTINDDEISKSFSKFTRQGKTRSALRLISKLEGSILDTSRKLDNKSDAEWTVLDELKSKHPKKVPVRSDVIITEKKRDFHPVIFEAINGDAIRRAALSTNGAAGPSGIDAAGWKRLCTSFKHHSSNLCNSLAQVAKKLSGEYVDPEGITSLIASRLIAIDKLLGVRPIAIGETARRIISKASLAVVKDEVKEVAGSIQLCAGQEGGCEAGVHATKEIFENVNTEAALLVDAKNAFNLLNRQTALINIHSLCPSIATVLTNIYRGDGDLFIEDQTLKSCKGTMQGDPLAMSMYAIGILPLIWKLDNAKQIWFTDDAAAGGSVPQLKEWWDKLLELGPAYGYYPNPQKTWLIVKDENEEMAKEMFKYSGVNITTSGRKHLGAALGSEEFLKKFMEAKIDDWCLEIEKLSEIARREPHSAYSAFVHGITSKWLYVMRTVPNISQLLTPLEEKIRMKLIPAITGRNAISDSERDLLALPCRLGGLGIINPTKISSIQHHNSEKITKPLVEMIIQQKQLCPSDVWMNMKSLKEEILKEKRAHYDKTADDIELDDSLRRCVDLAKEKGASIWLTTLPLEKHGFALYRSAFRDALALRYNWLPNSLPTKCACKKAFSIEHALSCPKGAYPTHRHNELRDITASLLSEVCKDVSTEPELQPLEGHDLRHATANKEDQARADILAGGFWGTHQRAFFDIKVFNPFAPSNRRFPLPSCYKHHERIKKCAYEQRITEVELGNFTPLIFSTSGGIGKTADIFYKRLASMIAERRKMSYQCTIVWMRCQLNFSLIRSAIMCLRGSRYHYPPRLPESIDLTIAESRLRV